MTAHSHQDKAPMVITQEWRWLPASSTSQLPSPEQAESWRGQQSHAQEAATRTTLPLCLLSRDNVRLRTREAKPKWSHLRGGLVLRAGRRQLA